MQPEAGFVEVGAGRLFYLHFRPLSGPPRARVLCLPALGEEMNKCRRLSALTGAALAAADFECVQIDLSGTGDSSGEFEQAGWTQWATDLVEGWRALAGADLAPAPILLAMRGGALLLGAVRELLEIEPARVAAVQPVLDGQQYLQQLLRVRVMASKFAGPEESMADLKARLDGGESLELAGYAFTAGLAAALAQARLRPAMLGGQRPGRMIEIPSAGRSAPSVQYQRFIAAADDGAAGLEIETVAAPQFWASQEIAAPERVVEAVCRACSDDG